MAETGDVSVGQVVYSKCGRDKGLPFVVVSLDGDYAALVDGGLRPLARPKRKKIKHLQPVKHIDVVMQTKLLERQRTENADFRKVLEPFQRNGTSWVR